MLRFLYQFSNGCFSMNRCIILIKIDGLVREGNKYKDNHPSKPSALRLPVKTIGAILGG
jgi:hypothetical protein